MKKIPLTQGKYALVDDEDFKRLSTQKWCLLRGYSHPIGYAVGYDYTNGWRNRKRVYMHRFILGTPPANLDVDHIDGNSLNNCKKNLRLCTRSQNLANRGKSKLNTTGFKAVTYDKRMALFGVMISGVHLGYYKTAEEAHEAYKKAALKLYGEFAKW